MPDHTLFENDHMAVIDRDGWTFVREADRVVILPYRDGLTGPRYLVRVETVPAHTTRTHTCAVAGTMEEGESPIQTAVRELFEETGYKATPDHLVPLGVSYITKGASNRVFYFCCDVRRLPRTTAPGDGSILEAIAETRWLSRQQMLNVPDPMLQACLLRWEGHENSGLQSFRWR